jgi:hypothetical protein
MNAFVDHGNRLVTCIIAENVQSLGVHVASLKSWITVHIVQVAWRTHLFLISELAIAQTAFYVQIAVSFKF